MKLYTINATPVQGDGTDAQSVARNKARIEAYPKVVAESILAKYGVDGFTIYQVMGYWKGKPEVSFKIELALDKDEERAIVHPDELVRAISVDLRDTYNQEAVMITHPDGTVEFE